MFVSGKCGEHWLFNCDFNLFFFFFFVFQLFDWSCSASLSYNYYKCQSQRKFYRRFPTDIIIIHAACGVPHLSEWNPIRMYHVAFMARWNWYMFDRIQTGLIKYADRFMTYTTICYSYVFESHIFINDNDSNFTCTSISLVGLSPSLPDSRMTE